MLYYLFYNGAKIIASKMQNERNTKVKITFLTKQLINSITKEMQFYGRRLCVDNFIKWFAEDNSKIIMRNYFHRYKVWPIMSGLQRLIHKKESNYSDSERRTELKNVAKKYQELNPGFRSHSHTKKIHQSVTFSVRNKVSVHSETKTRIMYPNNIIYAHKRRALSHSHELFYAFFRL